MTNTKVKSQDLSRGFKWLVATVLLFLSTSSVRFASAADMSKGADNFYKSNKVTMQKITFNNQYNMKVAGNLFRNNFV